MRRMTSVLTAAVAVTLLCSTPTAAQTPPTSQDKATPDAPRARTPRQELDDAKRLLDGINEASLDGEASRRLVTLKRDVNELAAAYLGQTSTAPPAGPADRPAATSGSTGTSIPGSANAGKTTDWKVKYTAVENDLRELLGSGSNVPSGSTTASPAPVAGGIANLNAAVRGQLQDVRTHLQLFYTQTVGQPVKPGAVK